MRGTTTVVLSVLFVVILLSVVLSIFWMTSSRLKMFQLKAPEKVFSEAFKKYKSIEMGVKSATFSSLRNALYVGLAENRDWRELFEEYLRESEETINSIYPGSARISEIGDNYVEWRIELDEGLIRINATKKVEFDVPEIPQNDPQPMVGVERFENEEMISLATGRIEGNVVKLKYRVGRKIEKIRYYENGNSVDTWIMKVSEFDGGEVEACPPPSWLESRIVCINGKAYGCGFGEWIERTDEEPSVVWIKDNWVCMHQGDKYLGRYWICRADECLNNEERVSYEQLYPALYP